MGDRREMGSLLKYSLELVIDEFLEQRIAFQVKCL